MIHLKYCIWFVASLLYNPIPLIPLMFKRQIRSKHANWVKTPKCIVYDVHDLVISSSMFHIPLLWSLGASSPDCPGSAEVTALYQTPGSPQIWACQSVWWLRSQPVGPGWAGSLLSQRDLGFVLASRQTRSWPQLKRRKEEKMEDIT